MPRKVIICELRVLDKDSGIGIECSGHLEPLCHSQTMAARDYDGSDETAHFYACSSCNAIFLANSRDGFHTSDLSEYVGPLTKEEIKQVVPKHCGLWSVEDDDHAVAELRPPNEMVVTPNHNLISIPKAWVGKRVKIQLA